MGASTGAYYTCTATPPTSDCGAAIELVGNTSTRGAGPTGRARSYILDDASQRSLEIRGESLRSVGELCDLRNDPVEFENQCDLPATGNVKTGLLLLSYDEVVRSMNHSPDCVAPT